MTHQRQRHTQACPSDASRPEQSVSLTARRKYGRQSEKSKQVSAVDKVTDSHASIVYSAMGLGPMLGRGLLDRHIRAGCMQMWRGPSAGLSRVGQLEPASWEMGEGGGRCSPKMEFNAAIGDVWMVLLVSFCFSFARTGV
jgi:hypothetical protein